MGTDTQQDPEKKDIEFILNFIKKKKFIEAENETNKLIINFPNSPILFNVLGAVLLNKINLKKQLKIIRKL